MVPGYSDTSSLFIAISGAVVNHVDGDGTAPDPLVWSAGALPKRRRFVHAVRERAFLPGPAGIWEGEWIAHYDFGLGLLLLGSWLSGLPTGQRLELIWGLEVISSVEILFYELWGGERLALEKAVPR